MSALARRYARAAVEAAEQDGGRASVEELVRGLEAFVRLYTSTSELRELLENPALSPQREAALKSVLDRLATSKEASALVRMLAERERIDLLDDLVEEARQLADDQAGRVRARVTSAVELDSVQTGRIAAALKRRLGRDVAVAVSINPEILGGLVCQVGDLTFDTSLRRQLQLLHEQLEGGTLARK